MSKLPEHILDTKIAIIGGSFSGILTALLLRAYGFRAIEILEKWPRVFPQNASFMNAGTLIHHLNFWGDPESFQKMIAACLFFLRVFPSSMFAAGRSNLLLPNDPQNPAIHRWTKDESSAINNLQELRRIYEMHISTTGHAPFGHLDELFYQLNESQLVQQYGDPTVTSKKWLWVDGVFDTAFNVAQFFADPDALIKHLYSHLMALNGNGIVVKTNSLISDIIPRGAGFDVKNWSVSLGHFQAVVGQAHAGNFSLNMPWMNEKIPCHMRRKGLLLMDWKGLNIPPTVMIRGFYGAFLPVWDDKFLVISGKHFDLDEIHFPQGGNNLSEKLQQWDNDPISSYSSWASEDDFAAAVIDDVTQRLPIVRQMKLVRPIFGTHVYDPSRRDASPDVASVRDKNLIAHEFQNGHSIFLAAWHTKLTTIPMSTVHIVNRILMTLSGGKHLWIPFNEYGFPLIPEEVLDSWVTREAAPPAESYIQFK